MKSFFIITTTLSVIVTSFAFGLSLHIPQYPQKSSAHMQEF